MEKEDINNKKENILSEKDFELLSLRFDFAWKWFDFHGKQRISLFNYFLIITGILINGYVAAIEKNLLILATAICFIGIIQSFGFIIFDIRNRQLIKYSEDILEKLERDLIYPDSFPNIFAHNRINMGEHIGLLSRDSTNKMREDQGKSISKSKFFKMKWWIRILYVNVMITFSLGLIYILFYTLSFSTKNSKTEKHASSIDTIYIIKQQIDTVKIFKTIPIFKTDTLK